MSWASFMNPSSKPETSSARLMTIDPAEELEGTGVTADAVHPAIFMATSMVLDRGGTPMATIDEGVRRRLRELARELTGRE